MRVGQLIGAGSGRNVSLYCLIRDIDYLGVHAHVINGDWRISFNKGATICHEPGGDKVIDAKILYTGDIPRHLQFEYYGTATYGEAIEFMNARMNSRVPLWVYAMISSVTVRTSRLTNALSAGKRAFMDAWSPRKDVKEEEDFFDDDIPF